jgi:hypothetical protein
MDRAAGTPVPSGSYLVISDTATGIGDGASRVASKINPRMGPTRLTPRPRGEASPHVVINALAGVTREP